MPYATAEGLVKRYGEKSIKTLAGSVDSAKVAEALDDASQTIDSYLAGRYTLPLKSVPAVLERHCCYIARYFLEKNLATEQARRDYDDSIRYLEKVASGTISLGISEDGKTVEGDNVAIIESQGSVWARDRAKGFI
ncbi:gp436 family protein [Aggregatibacter actinomycetemcomitans]|uniref:gp436 family protein n=1 Tax=Aggregatibacter actinomycetemcomitans TaxID=714 RepID=UPI001E3E75FC|nr:phage protein Gp36 family protein [Aggregatibacter actinomycetemcomitans]